MINYLDRQTLANLSVRITKALSLSEEQYGNLEFALMADGVAPAARHLARVSHASCSGWRPTFEEGNLS